MELRLLSSIEPGFGLAVSALALTYLVHSAVWAAAVALLACSKALSSATRHAYWKAALFGPLLSACVAVSAPRDLFAPQWFDDASLAGASSVAPKPRERDPAAAHSEALDAVAGLLPSGGTLGLVLLVGMGVGLLRFGALVYLLRSSLRGRVLVADGRILARFARLRARTKVGPVELTVSRALESPLVIGVGEICVPHALFSELPPADMDAVLAHELAHLERRDGVWFPLVAAVQSTLWLQPLNHLVSARFRSSAELACDDRAVELTGSPLGLARALVHVASSASRARPSLFVPTMLRHRGALIPRVRRLTEASKAVNPKTDAHGRWKALLPLLVIGAALATLSVRVAGARSEFPDVLAPVGAFPAAASRPDVVQQSAEMAKLVAREQALVRELVAEETRRRVGVTGSPDAVRALELAQELRHVRAMQSWLEERFVAEWTAFEEGSMARR